MRNQLIEKAEKLLKIKTVRDIYENILPYNEHFSPDSDPLDKAFLVNEIILRLGEGPEIEELAENMDRGPELNLPGSKGKIDVSAQAKELANRTYKQVLDTMEQALQLHKEKRLFFK